MLTSPPCENPTPLPQPNHDATRRHLTMQILFTLDALSDSGKNSWRLEKDGQQWRPATFAEDIASGDALFTNRDTLRPQIGLQLTPNRQFGLIAKARPGILNILQRGIYSHAIVHRCGAAPIPDQQQMIDTLRQMSVGTAQLLYIDLGGIFRRHDATDLVHNPAIAVRGEIASSENFIGEKAANNHALTDNLWQQYISGWWQHLASRRINTFIPDLERCPTVENALAGIENFQPEAQP
ncbi:MAG: hypothetical protein Q9M26_05305 [Mariprofundales bacterium]|nr:hypothetical protein [Mariprofundales bacterium]